MMLWLGFSSCFPRKFRTSDRPLDSYPWNRFPVVAWTYSGVPVHLNDQLSGQISSLPDTALIGSIPQLECRARFVARDLTIIASNTCWSTSVSFLM